MVAAQHSKCCIRKDVRVRVSPLAHFMKTEILVIVGPTAVGKSDLAVKLARRYGGEIISADSRQVYKGLDIGTGKITKKEMGGVRHHLLDVANPKKQFSVVKFVELAEKAIEGIKSRHKIPIICGGTGFYIQALVDGVILPDVPPDPELRKKLSKKSLENLLIILKKLDPLRAKNIDQKNSRRIIRAIEIATSLGQVPQVQKIPSPYTPLFIGVRIDREELKKKIKSRLDKRLKKGMVEEVKNLHKRGLSWKRMNELGLEYRYVAFYLQKKITLEKMREKLATEIRRYAKRQMTWFKRDKRIKWFQLNETRKIEKEIRKFL